MIATLMIYCFWVAALISVAAFASERAFAALGWPRRAVWIAALTVSLCLPVFMIANGDSGARPTIASPATAIEVAAVVGGVADSETPAALPSVSVILKGLWLIGSVGLLAFAFVGWLRLRLAARKWTPQLVAGVEVQVADNLGPAVFGFINPKIVVPRWLLAAPAADRNAAIEHERSHIAARDTLLLLLGLLLVVITPWNLPMWWQLRRLRFAIEVDCDQRVLSNGTSVASYGEMLLAVGQRKSRTPIGAMALTEPASQLERRIRIMTSGTIRHIKVLILVSLAMSVSLVTVAAQLDAPPLSGIAPNMFTSNVANPPGSRTDVSATELSAMSAAKDSTPKVDPIASKVSNVAARPVKRLALAPLPAKDARPKNEPGEFLYRAERIDADGALHDVVVQRRTGEKVEFAKAPRATLREAGPGLQILTLYDGERYEEGPGSSNSRERFPEAKLLVRAPAEVTTKLALAAENTESAPATGQKSSAARLGPKRIYYVEPTYPDSALQAGINDGLVDIDFTIAVTGDVQNAKVVKSEPAGIFDESALTAVRQWRFEPAIKDGQAVDTHSRIRLKFRPGPYNTYPKTDLPPSGAAVETNAQAPTSVAYTGERLTLKFTDIDLREVLKRLADSSGKDILISDKVNGKITIRLADTPWDQALDIILRAKGLVKRQQGAIILIEPGTTQTPL